MISTLKVWIRESKNAVFFGGAGVSTESGIPDFRSVDGLYRQKFEYPPEEIISHSFYRKNPEYFLKLPRTKLPSEENSKAELMKSPAISAASL